MGTGSLLYRIVLLVHIGAAIVGFGGLITHSLYHGRAFRAPVGQARLLLTTTQSASRLAHLGVYAVLLAGIVLVAVSDGAFSFSDGWITAAFTVWIVLVGVSHGLVRPAVAKLDERATTLATDPSTAGTALSEDAEADGIAKRLALGEGLLQLLAAIALVLMIWKPF